MNWIVMAGAAVGCAARNPTGTYSQAHRSQLAKGVTAGAAVSVMVGAAYGTSAAVPADP